MKIRYEAQKGLRIKKGSTKVKGRRNRVNNFWGIYITGMWWSWNDKKWFDDTSQIKGAYSTTNHEVTNLKQAIRHIKKHDYLPKGTRVTLESSFAGYDIRVTK